MNTEMDLLQTIYNEQTKNLLRLQIELLNKEAKIEELNEEINGLLKMITDARNTG